MTNWRTANNRRRRLERRRANLRRVLRWGLATIAEAFQEKRGATYPGRGSPPSKVAFTYGGRRVGKSWLMDYMIRELKAAPLYSHEGRLIGAALTFLRGIVSTDMPIKLPIEKDAHHGPS